MNLRFLETFVRAARLKSFSLTADKLRTTQAGVSSRIATLERELGVRLFEWDGREVRLTAEGMNALEDAEAFPRAAGCDAAQGFLLGRPMPAEEPTAALRGGRRPER